MTNFFDTIVPGHPDNLFSLKEYIKSHSPEEMESIAVLDTPGAHLVKASIYQNLNRRREAIRESDWVIAKFPDLEQEHLAARQMRNQI